MRIQGPFDSYTKRSSQPDREGTRSRRDRRHQLGDRRRLPLPDCPGGRQPEQRRRAFSGCSGCDPVGQRRPPESASFGCPDRGPQSCSRDPQVSAAGRTSDHQLGIDRRVHGRSATGSRRRASHRSRDRQARQSRGGRKESRTHVGANQVRRSRIRDAAPSPERRTGRVGPRSRIHDVARTRKEDGRETTNSATNDCVARKRLRRLQPTPRNWPRTSPSGRRTSTAYSGCSS
jgi:hypothetical protein